MEALINCHSSELLDHLETAVRNHLETSLSAYHNGAVDFSSNNYLLQHIVNICVCDLPETIISVPFWQAELQIHLYSLNTEGSVAEMLEGAGDVTAYHEWMLPCTEFNSLWEQYV